MSFTHLSSNLEPDPTPLIGYKSLILPAKECLSSSFLCGCCCTAEDRSEAEDENASLTSMTSEPGETLWVTPPSSPLSSPPPSPLIVRPSITLVPNEGLTLQALTLALDEDDKVEEMLQSLSSDELETAARCDYNYLKNPCLQQRDAVARKMAVRYLRSKHDTEKALKYMKSTIEFRQKLDVDGLRLAFEETNSDSCVCRDQLKKHLSSKMVYVQGYDKQGRATYIFEPCRVQCHDEEWTIKQHVWTLERAIACTKVQDKTVNAVINFNGFSAFKHSPPTQVGKQFLDTLRNHYIGHVNQIYIIDAPRTFLYLWAIFKPMLSKATKSKIEFVSSSKEKYQKIGKMYSNDQATPWMLPTGTKSRELDIHEYLFKIPFNQAFDDCIMLDTAAMI